VRRGVLLHTWGPPRRNAISLDADSGIAVYRTFGGLTYAVRLSDGKTTLLARGVDGVVIESAGVVYSQSNDRLFLYTLGQVQAALG
jgi:hypothetical protein